MEGKGMYNSTRPTRPIPNRKITNDPANGLMTVRKMTAEEWARTDLFIPHDKEFKPLNLHMGRSGEIEHR